MRCSGCLQLWLLDTPTAQNSAYNISNGKSDLLRAIIQDPQFTLDFSHCAADILMLLKTRFAAQEMSFDLHRYLNTSL